MTNVISLDDERRKRGLPPPLVEALSIAFVATIFAVGLGLMGWLSAMVIAGAL